MAQGVFSLNKVYKKQYQNVIDKNFSSWPESAEYGYFAGGSTFPTIVNTISRLDLSNENVSLPGNNLPTARSTFAATSSSSYGYFGGGLNPTIFFSTISRLDFSNETNSLPGKNLPETRGAFAATSSSSYGYFAGGNTNNTPPIVVNNTISRLDFSNENVSLPGKNLPSVTQNLAATSSSSYGYFYGGATITPPGATSVIATVVRLDFFNENVSIPGNISSVREHTAVSSALYGYFAGGGISLTGVTTISRLDFSNETTVLSIASGLPTGRKNLAAVSSSSYGYFGGGYTFPGTTYNTISRLDFSNETNSLPGKNLPTITSYLAALSGGQSI